MTTCDAGYWSLLPPLISISIAVLTKEIIISMLLGLFSGALIYAIFQGGSVLLAIDTIMTVLSGKVGENMPMVMFLLLLGALVAIMNAAGGAKAYGDWAYKRLKTPQSASLMTCLMGVVIFIDDYFNCLTVGSVMRPVTDRFNISREKLAYFIDATAAPICIMAPVSSWAAYVISCMPDEFKAEGMKLFIKTIPVNIYGILTIIMVLIIALRKNSDYGRMRRIERIARWKGRLGAERVIRTGVQEASNVSGKGRVYDLVIPIVFLVLCSFLTLLHYGGYWNSQESVSIAQAIGGSDPGKALTVSSFASIILAFVMYVPRRLLSFQSFSASMLLGFKTMLPPIVMLALAWGLSGVCNDLIGTGHTISGMVKSTGVCAGILPAVMFVLSALFAFATGASWCVIGILVPVIFHICNGLAPSYIVVSLAATLSGAVWGDHCSPIADTTILSSAGADCNHMSHVATQMPYAVTVGIASTVGFLVAGFLNGRGYCVMACVSIALSTVLLFAMVVVITHFVRKRHRS